MRACGAMLESVVEPEGVGPVVVEPEGVGVVAESEGWSCLRNTGLQKEIKISRSPLDSVDHAIPRRSTGS